MTGPNSAVGHPGLSDTVHASISIGVAPSRPPIVSLAIATDATDDAKPRATHAPIIDLHRFDIITLPSATVAMR